MRRNEKIFYWIIDKLFKHPIGKILPWYLYALKIFFMPLLWLRWKLNNNRNFSYDLSQDIFTIYGMKYAGSLFRAWGEGGMTTGEWLQFRRDKEAIRLRMIYPHIIHVDANARTLYIPTISLIEPEEYYIFRKDKTA